MRPCACLPLVSLAIPALLAACSSSQPRNIEKVGKTGLSSDILDAKLTEACDNYVRAVSVTAAELARGIDDPTQRRRLIQWRYGTLIATDNAYSMRLRFEGIASLYIMALQRIEFLSREGREAYLDQHEAEALAVERGMAEYLDGTFRELLPEDAYNNIVPYLRTFAAENPIDGLIRKYGDATAARKQSGTFLKLSTLTEPLMITEGVKETAVSISEVADSVNRVGRTVDSIPATTALELELLLLNLRDDPMIADLRGSVTSMSESAARFATVSEQLPTRIREEIVQGLDEIEATRADLRDVVDKAAVTATEARKAVEQAGITMNEAQTVLASVQQTSKNLAEAGRAWGPAFESLRKITNPRGDDYVPPPPEPGPDRDLENLARTAEGISAAGEKLHAAIVELRATLDSGTLPGTLGEVDTTARGTVDYTTERLAELVDLITLRVAQLVGAIVVATLLYRFLRRYVPGPAAR